MNQRELKAIRRRIVAAEKRVAKERDALRDLMSDLEALDDSCERAADCLQGAVDALSELV